jgi:hypothetical protein
MLQKEQVSKAAAAQIAERDAEIVTLNTTLLQENARTEQALKVRLCLNVSLCGCDQVLPCSVSSAFQV